MNKKILFPLICWLIAIALPWIWLCVPFANPSFSLVDDALDLKLFRAMDSDWTAWANTTGFRGEINNGRLRPVYWLSRFLFHYLPFKSNPAGWLLSQYLILALILSVIFFLLKALTQSPLAALLGSALWTLNGKTMENFSRLAPAEDTQLLWFSLATAGIYFLFQRRKKEYFLYPFIFVMLFLAYFTKETSVLLLPFFFLMGTGSLLLKKARREWLILFGMNLFLFALQRFLSPPIGGYASSFANSLTIILQNLRLYPWRIQWFLLLPFAVFSYGYRLFRQGFPRRQPDVRAEITYWQFACLLLGTGFFLILLPWGQPVPRYLVISDFFFALFLTLELRVLWHSLSQKSWLAEVSSQKLKAILRPASKSFFLAACFLLAFLSEENLYWEMRYAYATAGHPTPVQDLQLFAQKAEKNSRVLFYEVEIELVAATEIFLRDIFDRKDLRLYNPSSSAATLREEGYSLLPVKQEEWPQIIDQIDYIYWKHQGLRRAMVDLFHLQLMNQLLQSDYAAGLEKIYDDLYFPVKKGLPEGTEIWKINHEKIRAYRESKNKTKTADA